MTIHQLQASYVTEQDRILVRLNTHAGEELRLWLTRRMVKNLFPHMMKVTTELIATPAQNTGGDGTDPKAAVQFKIQESLRQADFVTPFKSQATTLPIGESPLLATTVHITPSEGGGLRIGFEEKVPDQAGSRSFEVTLGQDLLHGFMHLLEAALQHADWGMTLNQLVSRADAEVADVFAAAEPPQYLN
jgi:hypothetical protein